MQIREFAKPVTAKSLNESLAQRFGTKLNLEKFTLEQLQDARNKLRTQLFNVETNESFDSVQDETYQKSKLMLDVLNAEISERGDIEEESLDEKAKPDYLDFDGDGNKKEPMKKALKDKKKKPVKEGAEDHAELVMAAKEMVDRVTGWMEDTAEMQSESMLELADAIRDEMGQQAADGFTNTVKPALDAMYSAMEGTREALNSGVGMLTGEGSDMGTMGADDDMGDMDMEMEPTADMDATGDDLEAELGGDDFGAAEPATGGEEGADRAKRESIQHVVKKVTKEGVNGRKLVASLSKKK